MEKIVSLSEAIAFSKKSKQQNKTIGFVVGGFDVCHLGHLNLFRLAKKHTDFVIVGLDSDETIKKNKGNNRPINNYRRRSEFLSDLITVDRIFPIKKSVVYGSRDSLELYIDLVKKIKPTHVFTHKVCDKYWREKKAVAEKMGMKMVLDLSPKIAHSSEIIKKLEKE